MDGSDSQTRGKVMSKSSSVAKQSAEWIRDRYKTVWGFFDNRVQAGFVDSTILMHLRLQDASVLEGKSAEWLAERLEQWRTECVELLASKYHMSIEDFR